MTIELIAAGVSVAEDFNAGTSANDSGILADYGMDCPGMIAECV